MEKSVKAWEGFAPGKWQDEVNVRDFIQKNYRPYEDGDAFLADVSADTAVLWEKCLELAAEENKKGVLDIDLEHIAGINSFGPGYLDREKEKIVGFQTDAPLKRMINPFGGLRMATDSLKAYGYEPDPYLEKTFTSYRKTHNQGVFDVYTDGIKKMRSAGLLTGLPDAYGRGRIIGDYRRIALYGLDFLIEEKKKDFAALTVEMDEETIRLREEIAEQIRSMEAMKEMAASYGSDISSPAENSQEAVQSVYFGYLAAVKENNGAAMSLGRVNTFLDIYFERDLEKGVITEAEIQELVDQFVMKLRMVRHLRTPEYNDLFAGDPNWVTESIGGMGEDGRALVTRTAFRFLHTLKNLGPAPEPNLTVLWSQDLPDNFKRFCSRMSIETSSIQYENDDIMRPLYGDDYGIACCVSAMRLGKEMQFFGARCNLAKALLYALNEGRDEKSGVEIVPGIPRISSEVLDYDEVMQNYVKVLRYVAKQYVDAMNIIHYMHDKYAYEAGQMALHDSSVGRYTAFGVAGLSVVADSLSAIRYGKTTAVRREDLALDFETENDFPKFGNDDDNVDKFAVDIVNRFIGYLKEHRLYRDAVHTLSVLTITSNVVYGKKTGTTPDGRQAGEPFAPGANPMHGRDERGALASLNSVAKIPYCDMCRDGVSNTFSVVPDVLGRENKTMIENMKGILDGYFSKGAHHLNVNVMNREILLDAMEHPEKYPALTIRVSGYAVHFNRLTREQQEEVVSRTFHNTMCC